MTKLVKIEGIGKEYAQKLEAVGISSIEKLLDAGCTPKGRKDLAGKTGLSSKLILKWVNRADMTRVKGIGEEYADLLELAGVDTVPELARRKAANLRETMAQLNEAKKLVRRLPPESVVDTWVQLAKGLPRKVTY
jgi:predicted flap endonuclease-1-like 5' DNA nuclease